MRVINIWCDASQHRVEQTELNPRGRKVSFAVWTADTGHYWYDVVYARQSHDAEITAVLVALDWALVAGYEKINIYTDDKSIPESLYGKRKGKGMGDLPEIIDESIADINIIAISRKKNRPAHKLCDETYKGFLGQGKFPKGKKTRTYLTRYAIKQAKKNRKMRAVCEPSVTEIQIIERQASSG